VDTISLYVNYDSNVFDSSCLLRSSQHYFGSYRIIIMSVQALIVSIYSELLL